MDIIGNLDIRRLWDGLARQHGERTALVFEDSLGHARAYSYADMNGEINRAANLFASLGVEKGDKVAVQFGNSPEFLFCWFGLAKIGAVFVPLNIHFQQEECAYILKRYGIRLVIVEERYRPLYDEADSLRILVVRTENSCRNDAADDFVQLLRGQSRRLAHAAPLSGEDPAEILLTSGTTSCPKGVVITHHNLCFAGYYTAWQGGLRSDDVYLTMMPAFHIDCQCTAVMPTFVAGAALVLLERYSARAFWSQICRYRATVTECIPLMVRTLLMQPRVPWETRHCLREVFFYLNLADEEKDAFVQRFNVRLLTSYGMTETIVGVIGDRPGDKRKWPSIGRVGFGYDAKIADENGNDLPVGKAGEIWIRGVPGKTLFKEYYGDPEATARTLDADGWLRTGDCGYVDGEGFFYFLGRNVNMVKRSGENVSCTEIENVLCCHPKIMEAAVVGVPDCIYDEEIQAFAVPIQGETVTEKELLAYLGKRLAKFKVPAAVHVRPCLPRTSTGKVQKYRLQEEARGLLPAPPARDVPAATASPLKKRSSTMALKLDMQGKTYGPFERSYTFRELSLFALGCGAGLDGKTDLEYVYEKDMKVLPMFAAMPIVDSEVTKTIDYGFNWGGSLHWGFDLRFHRPLTQLSGKFSTQVLLKGLYDRGEGRGLLAQHIGDTYDENGTLLFTNESWDCALYDGGFGGPTPPKDVVEMPDTAPDFEVTQTIPLNQALIYRLSGDFHPQHIDWEYAQQFGHPKPNLHAVSTAGAACRHIIRTCIPGQPERLTRFKTRITKPLYPGVTIKTQMWKWDANSIHFRVFNADDPSVMYLNFALAEWQ